MSIVLIALVSVGLSVAAQFSLKAGVAGAELSGALSSTTSGMSALLSLLTNKFVILGFVLYGFGAVVWLGVLAHWEVSKAYPLVGLGFVLTAIIGVLLGEQVTLLRAVGVLLICTGVYLVGQS